MLRGQMRYVLILDDVWRSFSLEDVGILEPTTNNGCKLVLTTRSERVVESMGFKKVKVPCFSMEEAMNLFLSKVGQDMLSNPTLESLMNLAVRECDGLPLAVFTLAGYMRGKSYPCMWEYPIQELRGYIRNINDMEDKIYGIAYHKEEISGKSWYAVGRGANMEEWGEDLEKVSLMENSISKIPQTMKCLKFPESFFEHFPNLEILDLSRNCFESLPNSTSSLEKLTGLLLRGCWDLKSLPCLSKLQASKELDLGGSGIEQIPQGLEMLVNLRYLNLRRTIRLTGIPTGTLSKLCRLQYLAIHFKLESAEELRELNKLEVFEGWFHNLCGLNTFASKRKTLYKFSILVSEITSVRPLVFSNVVRFKGIKIDVGDEIILPYGIKELSLLECRGVRSINDIGLRDATDLKKCELRGCSELESVISSHCDQLQKLESLDLIELENLKVIVEVGAGESSVGRFSSLKEITLWNCDKIKKLFSADWVLSNLRICSENGVMVCDSLRSITISDCPKLKRIPLYLPQLEIDDEGELSPSKSLQRIQVRPLDWWEAVEWEHPNFNIKNVVGPLVRVVEWD
ncbi:hypothetical protein GOBAR_AA15025 [Gossypium barbadense]|uniref:NB-ARC domain-containing protein n=1 Tax=Gossypium barbadense TaxID=3634 RepID=A0A2P5XQM3_GOSBA|nr:hypothetical protein GOBAR_AA15025 [Gossypium barbadense]